MLLFFDKFEFTGLKVKITQLDINMEKNEQAQVSLYKEVKHPNKISTVNLWGIHDTISWIKDKNQLPFFTNCEFKKAYYSIIQVAGA
jgi:GH35 family endo-1,4-beta-xylanase